MSFWNALPRPFFALAPMADVTDPAYRSMIARFGKPHVTWTEFVSADGLYHTRERKKMPDSENPLVRDIGYTEEERPIVAQFFSAHPDMMAYAAEYAARMGFDGIDINMGCPDSSVEKQGCGAAMIKNPELALRIVAAAKEGAMRGKEGGVPVSVKTRIGYAKEIIDEWIPQILSSNPAALTVHLRTRKEMSLVPAHWECMPRILALRDAHAPGVPVLGNGDVKDIADGAKKAQEYGCDGVMLGRGIFGNPWVFAGRKPEELTLAERLSALGELAESFEALRPQKSFHILKKHIKAFVHGFDGAGELRVRLMETENARDLKSVIEGTTV